MRSRSLGKTGLEVSEIGFGAWGIGGGEWSGTDEGASIEALHRAIDLGVTFIDTALDYGLGHSERLVGRVVRERSETVHVATKVPPIDSVWPALPGVPVEAVFTADHVRRCTKRSLENLRLDRIDLLQLHVWDDTWLGQGDWLEAVEELLSSGEVAFFGVSIDCHRPASALRVVRSGLVDAVQVIYNVFDQSPEDELFPACREYDVGVIARVPLDEGGLTGSIGLDREFPEGDFRAGYFSDDRRREVSERVRRIAEDLEIDEGDLAETALRFVLSEPTVSTVIPGMRSVRNVERNAAVSDGRALTHDQRERLRAHRWVRNFYD